MRERIITPHSPNTVWGKGKGERGKGKGERIDF